MNSKQVVSEFKAAGIKVRVRDFDIKFRIVGDAGCSRTQGATFQAIAARLGFTSAAGLPGGQFNTSCEFVAYKPGMVVRA
jgi:hypothetical protein